MIGFVLVVLAYLLMGTITAGLFCRWSHIHLLDGDDYAVAALAFWLWPLFAFAFLASVIMYPFIRAVRWIAK
jgi:hypothetical protein